MSSELDVSPPSVNSPARNAEDTSGPLFLSQIPTCSTHARALASLRKPRARLHPDRGFLAPLTIDKPRSPEKSQALWCDFGSAAAHGLDSLDRDYEGTAANIERRYQAQGTLGLGESRLGEFQLWVGRRSGELHDKCAGGSDSRVRLPSSRQAHPSLVQSEGDLSARGRRDGYVPARLGQLRARRERPPERVGGPQFTVATPLHGIEEPGAINARTRSAVKDSSRRKRARQAYDGAGGGAAGGSCGRGQRLVRAMYDAERDDYCGHHGCREHGNDERPATPVATSPAPMA